jgi:hypothetical protein
MIDAATRRLIRGLPVIDASIAASTRTKASYYIILSILSRENMAADHVENLALASHRCNLHGSNLSGIDPLTAVVVSLFNPRHERWQEHFAFPESMLTPVWDSRLATFPLKIQKRVWGPF